MKSDITIGEMIDKKIVQKTKKLAELDTKAKKENTLFNTLESIKIQWDVPSKININIANEIEKSEDLFDEIDDSLAKVADVQSSK